MLDQPNSDSISSLFSRSPVSWTDEDIKAMVAHYRKIRQSFSNEPTKRVSKTKTQSTEATAALLDLGISLDDLV